MEDLLKEITQKDVLVRTPEDIVERPRMGDFFIRRILQEGRVLYECPRT